MTPDDLLSPPLAAALDDVGRVDTPALCEARLQAHYAAQVLAATGFGYLPAVEDYSHTALRWDDARRGLSTGALPGGELRVGLSLAELRLVLHGAGVDERFETRGNTLQQAFAWADRMIQRHTDKQPEGGPLALPEHDLPEHALAEGAPFDGADAAAREELAAWFAAGAHAVTSVARGASDAGDPLCWPHHFDVATLITLSGSGEDAHTVGVGFSPGDGAYPCPYFYVNPWPRPEGRSLPELAGGGHWHTEGWLGAVLTADTITATSGGQARASLLAEFIASAVPAARTLAGETP